MWEPSVNLALHTAAPVPFSLPHVLLPPLAILCIVRTPEDYMSPFEGLLSHTPMTSLLCQLVLECNKGISRRKNTTAPFYFDVLSA